MQMVQVDTMRQRLVVLGLVGTFQVVKIYRCMFPALAASKPM